MTDANTDSISIHYTFTWPDRRVLAYDILINKASLLSRDPETQTLPEWTALDFEQCQGCPLQKSVTQHCPVATRLFELSEAFRSEKSYAEVDVKVETAERSVTKQIPLQKGVQSIFGALIATSGCPKTSLLRPMARFHLPFSNTEETVVRVLGFYFLSQYFAEKEGKSPDWKLQNLVKNYEELSLVNEGLSRRIHRATSIHGSAGDAMPNAIAILDAFAQILSMEIEAGFPSISYLFEKNK
jgi:hypothetical protein